MTSFDRRRLLMFPGSLFLIVMNVAGCATSPRRNVHQIVEELKESHPDGIPAGVAQTKMEENSFECEMITGGEFVHNALQDDGSTERKTYENIDFLDCHRSTQDGWVTSIDHVALVIKEDRVVDVLANWAAIGP